MTTHLPLNTLPLCQWVEFTGPYLQIPPALSDPFLVHAAEVLLRLWHAAPRLRVEGGACRNSSRQCANVMFRHSKHRYLPTHLLRSSTASIARSAVNSGPVKIHGVKELHTFCH